MYEDIWAKASEIFWKFGAFLGVIFFIVAIMALSTAENGALTVEGVEQFSATFESAYFFLKWPSLAWLGLGIVLFVRFLIRLFSRKG
jgi:hypothetical protein